MGTPGYSVGHPGSHSHELEADVPRAQDQTPATTWEEAAEPSPACAGTGSSSASAPGLLWVWACPASVLVELVSSSLVILNTDRQKSNPGSPSPLH